MLHSQNKKKIKNLILGNNVCFYDLLQVQEGGVISLTSDIIEISDPDTPLSDLSIVIAIKPAYGIIQNIAPGTIG